MLEEEPSLDAGFLHRGPWMWLLASRCPSRPTSPLGLWYLMGGNPEPPHLIGQWTQAGRWLEKFLAFGGHENVLLGSSAGS